MTALTIRDTTRILRPNSVGKCIEAGVYTPYESLHFLKIGTYHTGSSADYGVSILGVFNVSEQPLSELVALRDFEGIVKEDGREYIIRAHPSGEVSPPMNPDSDFPQVNLALDPKGWGILTAYPLHTTTSDASSSLEQETNIAVLGLIGKMTGAAAVVGTPRFEERGLEIVRINVVVKVLGVLGTFHFLSFSPTFPIPPFPLSNASPIRH